MAKNSLSEYSAKRSFGATPEPQGKVAAPVAGPLLFVVQMHSATRLHYDFRLECDGVLKSWAVPKGPSLNPADKRMAVMTEDHPYDYGSFEGVIPPRQYGAGEVIVWDCGVYTPDETGAWYHDRERAQAEIREGLAKGKLSVTLRGEKLKGSWALVRMAKEPKTWLLIKHKDRFAGATDVTALNRSVLSGVTVEEMTRVAVRRLPATQLVPSGKPVAMPDRLEPMHAELGDKPFTDPDWSWEPKLDGYRVLAHLGADGVKLRSRRGLDLTPSFPRLVAELGQQLEPVTPASSPRRKPGSSVAGAQKTLDSRFRGNDKLSMLLDGEIVALGPDGKPSFNALQNRVQLKTERELKAADASVPAVFYAFDLLHFAGIALQNFQYRDRRRYLSQCLLPSPLVQLVHAADDGVALHQAALASGFEGVIAKRKDSRYETGRRSGAWLKVKPTQSAEFVIGGYTKGKGSREAFGAILVGYWEGKKLRFASGVGSGFDDRGVAKMLELLKAREGKTMPFDEKPDVPGPMIWVEPELVVEVKFQSWTDDDHLRAPVFMRLRDDIEAKDVKRPPARRPNEATFGRKPIGSEGGRRAGGADPAIEEILAQLDSAKNAFTLACGEHRIKLTHLDRVYWPEDKALKQPPVTKRDLLRYFAQVSPHIIPHLTDRPLTLIRMPDGIGGQRFFQKHWEQERPPFVESVTVFSDSKSQQHNYLLCNNLPTLLWLAQSGTLEFHIWHSRAKLGADSPVKSTDYAASTQSLEGSILNYPDYVVFDIDPYIYSGKEKKGDEPELNTTAFEKGKEVAFWLREVLDEMSLEAVVKTSGKTGLHVFVPIKRTIDFDAARHVSELVGRHLLRQHPKDITMDWAVPKRTGKIFMDHNMNVRGKTLNVAYSPRGAAGAPVSMPLTWEELAKAHPLDFRITNAPQRLAAHGDRWRDVLELKQSLEKALKSR